MKRIAVVIFFIFAIFFSIGIAKNNSNDENIFLIEYPVEKLDDSIEKEQVEKLLVQKKSIESEKNIIHSVIKGECLWIIAKKYNIVDWHDIQNANNLKNTTIFPGQELIIPTNEESVIKAEFEESAEISMTIKKTPISIQFDSPLWTDLERDKYLGNLTEGLLILGYSPYIQQGFLEEIRNNNFVFATVFHSTHNLGRVTDKNGKSYRLEKMLAGGGKNQPIRIKQGLDGVIPNWNEDDIGKAGRLYRFGNNFLFIPLIYKNPIIVTLCL